MKANELMIGDWVIVRRPSNRREKVRVKSVIGNGTIEAKTSDGLVAIGELVVEPIPLNADIINQIHCHPKMAIFWDDRRTKETGENWYELRICTDGDTALNMEIRYVHELQHALRLCSIEKEIEL